MPNDSADRGIGEAARDSEQSTTARYRRLWPDEAPELGFKAHPHMQRHACGFAPVAAGLPGAQEYPAHRSLHHSRRLIADAIRSHIQLSEWRHLLGSESRRAGKQFAKPGVAGNGRSSRSRIARFTRPQSGAHLRACPPLAGDGAWTGAEEHPRGASDDQRRCRQRRHSRAT